MRNLFTYLRVGLLAVAVLLIGTVFLPSPASAQQGNLNVMVDCQPDGTYKVTYTLPWADAPASVLGTRLLTRSDTNDEFDSGWTSDPDAYSWIDRGPVTSPDGSVSWTRIIPGSTEGAGPWEYAWLDFGQLLPTFQFHSIRAEGLRGNCADTTAPDQVSVQVSFGDSSCDGGVYSEPTLDAPEVTGTSQEVTGTVEPGAKVDVVYQALDGFWIVGQSVFSHTYPSEPASQTDCDDAAEETGQTGASGPGAAGGQGRDRQSGEREDTPAAPRHIDAGLAGESWTSPSGPRWLAPLLGGVIVLGLAAFTRLKQLGDQHA